jgi:hypothetical protein
LNKHQERLPKRQPFLFFGQSSRSPNDLHAADPAETSQQATTGNSLQAKQAAPQRNACMMQKSLTSGNNWDKPF